MHLPSGGIYKLRQRICICGDEFLYSPVLQNLPHNRVEVEHLIEGLLICWVASSCAFLYFRVQLQLFIEQYPHLFWRGEVYSGVPCQFHRLGLNLCKFLAQLNAVFLKVAGVYLYTCIFHICKHFHKGSLNLPVEPFLPCLRKFLQNFIFQLQQQCTFCSRQFFLFLCHSSLRRICNGREKVRFCSGGEEVRDSLHIYIEVTFKEQILLVAPLGVDDIVHEFNVVYLSLELYPILP